MKFIYLFVIFFIISCKLFSQNSYHPKKTLKRLSPNELEDYNNYAIIKTKSFGKYLSYILDSELPILQRRKAANYARKLFVNNSVIVEDTIFSSAKPLTIEKFIIFLLKNEKKNLEIEWNDIYSKESFNISTAVKIVEIEQVVKFYNMLDYYLVDNLQTSYKIIETHFIQKDGSDPPIQIKLGKIQFKN